MHNTKEAAGSLRLKPRALLIASGLGIGLGLLAWRSHQSRAIPADRTLDDWSKPCVVVSPPGDATAEKARSEIEAAKQRAEDARPFIAEASKADKGQLQSLMTAYSAALKPLREPPLLDLTTVTELEQLRQKKETVQSFIRANEALRAFLGRREVVYRETLIKAGLPADSLDSVMEAYGRTAAEATALALKMRNDDSKMATALVGMLDLLEANWSQWKFDPAKQKVEFSDRASQEKFLDLKESLDRASLEQLACQAKLVALEPSK